MTYYTSGYCAKRHVFNTLLHYSKFTHSCWVSERREEKRKRQVMPPLELLIKFVLLLIIFQVTFSFNLLVANWRLPPEFWSPKFFSTRHGDQNGRSLERCTGMLFLVKWTQINIIWLCFWRLPKLSSHSSATFQNTCDILIQLTHTMYLY